MNVYVRELSRELGRRGIGVDIFTRSQDTKAPTTVALDRGVRVINLHTGSSVPYDKNWVLDYMPEFVSRVRCFADGQDLTYDLIHSHYWLSGMVGRQLKARHGVPLVHTMHTMARVKNSTLSEHQTSEPDDREHGEAAIVADADVLTANTPDEAAELQQHYGATTDQIRIVPPGVDLHTFHPCDQPHNRAQLGVDQEKQVILFVGRIQPLKAPDVLIRAVAELTELDPGRRDRLRLIIIGSPSGPDSEWSATLAPLARDLGVGDLVIFRPHSPRADLFRWYCVADVVGVPSYNESFGLVALEAQACGRPVVATDVGGLRHAVRDQVTGLLVPGQDVQDWAGALGTLLDDEAGRQRMGARAAAHASSFSWDNTAAATLAAYGAALDGGG